MKRGIVLENKKSIKQRNEDFKDDKKICIALMASFVVLTIQYFVLIYFDLIGSSMDLGVQSYALWYSFF